MENGSPPVLLLGMGGEHACDAEKFSILCYFFFFVFRAFIQFHHIWPFCRFPALLKTVAYDKRRSKRQMSLSFGGRSYCAHSGLLLLSPGHFSNKSFPLALLVPFSFSCSFWSRAGICLPQTNLAMRKAKEEGGQKSTIHRQYSLQAGGGAVGLLPSRKSKKKVPGRHRSSCQRRHSSSQRKTKPTTSSPASQP